MLSIGCGTDPESSAETSEASGNTSGNVNATITGTDGVSAGITVSTGTSGPATATNGTSATSAGGGQSSTTAGTGPSTGVGGAVGTTGATGSIPSGTLSITNLAIEPNPRMTLSAYVSWTTSEAANSEVQFGIDGYQYRIVDPNEVTEHRVHVVGMHPETAYSIKAVSTNQAATGSAEGDFTTGQVPADLPPKAELVHNQFEQMQPGWTLTNYHVGGSSNFSTSPAIRPLP